MAIYKAVQSHGGAVSGNAMWKAFEATQVAVVLAASGFCTTVVTWWFLSQVLDRGWQSMRDRYLKHLKDKTYEQLLACVPEV